MKYVELTPSAELKELVFNFWSFEVTGNSSEKSPYAHEVIPENSVSIVLINQPYFKGIRILGPQLQKFQQVIHPGSFFLGIRLNPWVVMNFLQRKTALVNQTKDAPSILMESFKDVNIDSLNTNFSNISLLEQGLLRLHRSNNIQVDPLIKWLCLQLEGARSIREITQEIPISVRPIQKKFKAVTGISMSQFRTITKMQKTIRSIYLDDRRVTSAALENNYTDHAHFLNTFKKYMNSSVKDFMSKTDKIELSI